MRRYRRRQSVHALADILPEIETVVGCIYHCDPAAPDDFCPVCLAKHELDQRLPGTFQQAVFAKLPRNITCDQLIGVIDPEQSFRDSKVHVTTGIRACVHCGLLLVDRLTRFPDYILNLVCAASTRGALTLDHDPGPQALVIFKAETPN